jgi:SAM-dependent methyltransferase
MPGSAHAGMATPSDWVCRWLHLVRPGGTALDLACGSGRHVREMARLGLRVTGVDRDEQAVAPLRGIAEILVADLERGPWPLEGRSFDAVVVTHYLWRPLMPRILGSLSAGGVLVYETFASGQQTVGRPSREDFLLRSGELLEVARGLRIVAFEDGFLDAPERFVQRIAAVRAGAEPSSVPPRHALNPGRAR